jgi:hypothetical protein
VHFCRFFATNFGVARQSKNFFSSTLNNYINAFSSFVEKLKEPRHKSHAYFSSFRPFENIITGSALAPALLCEP